MCWLLSDFNERIVFVTESLAMFLWMGISSGFLEMFSNPAIFSAQRWTFANSQPVPFKNAILQEATIDLSFLPLCLNGNSGEYKEDKQILDPLFPPWPQVWLEHCVGGGAVVVVAVKTQTMPIFIWRTTTDWLSYRHTNAVSLFSS